MGMALDEDERWLAPLLNYVRGRKAQFAAA